MSFLHRIIRGAAVIALLVSVAITPNARGDETFPDEWCFPNRGQPLLDLVGKPAPELSTDQWIGDQTTLQAARGKVVIVDFWATWCGPCMASIPHNVELVNKYKDKGLVFIGMHDANSGWEKAAGVVNDKGINYSVARDMSGGTSAKAFGVSFWPTYIAIDHRGVVRAAGLMPAHIGDVVEKLIAEMPAGGGDGGGNPPEWYLGGAQRPGWLRQAEGKRAAKLEGTEWLGKTLSPEESKGRVVVLHFVSPDSEIGIRQLLELAKLEPDLGPQGLSIVGVCDARADWTRAKMVFEQRGVKVSVVHDASTTASPAAAPKAVPDSVDPDAFDEGAPPPTPPPAKPADDKVDPKAIQLGKTATAHGIRLAPATIIIDKNGIVRAAGVKADKVKEIVNKLLAEPLADVPAPKA